MLGARRRPSRRPAVEGTGERRITSGRLPVRIPLFQPRVDSDDHLVEPVHDEELDTASCVDLESTTATPCKRVAQP